MPAVTEPTTEVTVLEAAEAHGIPKRTLHYAIERGQIPARRVGNLFLIDAEAARLYGAVFAARRALDEYTGRASAESVDA